MTADNWTRTSSLVTSPYGDAYFYKWVWGSRINADTAQRANPHTSFIPDMGAFGLRSVSQTIWYEPGGASSNQRVYRRLTSTPTWDGTQWVGGYREDVVVRVQIERVLDVRFPGTVGLVGMDQFSTPTSWEVGAADFAHPLPSWPWLNSPTHFYVGSGANGYIPSFIAAGSTGLHSRSEEAPWMGRGLNTSSPRNAGPMSARLTPARNSTTSRAVTHRRASDGALLASTYDSEGLSVVDGFTITDAEPIGIPAGETIVGMHYTVLPTLRARVWGFWSSGAVSGTWTVRAMGTEDAISTQTVSAAYTIGGSPFYEATLDTSLDLNSLTYPSGTVFLLVSFDPVLGQYDTYLSCLEGPWDTTFAPCGTRSSFGGSAYTPGRMIRVGTMDDDGATS